MATKKKTTPLAADKRPQKGPAKSSDEARGTEEAERKAAAKAEANARRTPVPTEAATTPEQPEDTDPRSLKEQAADAAEYAAEHGVRMRVNKGHMIMHPKHRVMDKQGNFLRTMHGKHKAGETLVWQGPLGGAPKAATPVDADNHVDAGMVEAIRLARIKYEGKKRADARLKAAGFQTAAEIEAEMVDDLREKIRKEEGPRIRAEMEKELADQVEAEEAEVDEDMETADQDG